MSTKHSSSEQFSTDESSSLINEDCIESADVVNKHNKQMGSPFYTINRFMKLMNPLITDESNCVQIYFDEVRDNSNTRFNQSQSKYVNVLSNEWK